MLLADTGIVFKGIKPLQRLGAAARELGFKNPLAGMAVPARIPDHLRAVLPDPWPGDVQRGRELIAGVFHFAGQTIERDALSWAPPGASDAWIQALHGFEWLRDLRSVGGERARRMAREMVGGWIDSCQKQSGPAWRPDVVGARLSAWISFHDLFCAAAPAAFRKAYFASLARQARYLSRTLPGTLTGLPLMKALKGLACSGLALDDGEDRVEQALSLITSCVRAQVLPDGSHISRSPQQTFDLLHVLVDLRAAMMAVRAPLPDELQRAIDRIAPAVKFFRHADGALSLFNGAQEGNTHLIEATLMHSGAKGKALRALPQGGFERLQMGRSSLIMDVGAPIGSAHGDRAHAGALSFEYAYGRDRVIVNCGSSAAPGRWREILRQTAAHSTLIAGAEDSCGFDTNGRPVSLPDVQSSRREDTAYAVLEASHTGYLSRLETRHDRRLRLSDMGDALRGEDRLKGKPGVPYAVRFHLHLGIQASVIKDGTEILLRGRSGAGWRFSAGGAIVTLEDSVYGGEGETPRRAQQIVVQGVTASAETLILWDLRREK